APAEPPRPRATIAAPAAPMNVLLCIFFLPKVTAGSPSRAYDVRTMKVFRMSGPRPDRPRPGVASACSPFVVVAENTSLPPSAKDPTVRMGPALKPDGALVHKALRMSRPSRYVP